MASPYLRAFVPVPGEDEPTKPGSPEFWEKLFISIGLVLIGGVFAGLTLGLMGLDELHLRVLAQSSDDPKEKKNAAKGRLSLVLSRLQVLLLGNVIVNESLPIFLDSALGGGVAAIVIATLAIVVFGIIPQALSVRYGLAIGAMCSPLVLGMMYIFAPVAYPLAKLLDWILGADEHHTYKKAELKSFLQFHRTGEEPLRDDEINILNGVLELNTKSVEEIMTPMKDVVNLSSDTILDHKAVDSILMSGYSRFPRPRSRQTFVFYRDFACEKGTPGSALEQSRTQMNPRTQLLTYDPAKAMPVSSFSLSILPEALPNINCFQALDYFQTGRAHLLLISRTPGRAGGAIGEIISEEIVDETDRIVERERRRGDSVERAPLIGSRTNSTIREDQEGEQAFEPYTDSPTTADDEATPKLPHVSFALSESPKPNFTS
ncbi:hypothetical protein BKA70DRAFT_1524767 [Coprinopsis sp. MPI-PUGE-AT-0042]|nr:hypothetical protein BKA70DRAFT_1524767 [Coprinopsis sp. MPI-PUGE-AT-0042]